MDKRSVLRAGLASAALPSAAWAAQPGHARGPGLLTVSGAVTRSNRGPFDPALDQLMVKHKVAFERAWTFDAAMLARLPALTIQPTVEYDARPHRLSGPRLSALLEAAGAPTAPATMLRLRAIDGYVVQVSLADARAWPMIVATAMDGAPMALGGLGPLWAVYDADRIAAFRDKPLKERFGLCPWGLYAIDVLAG